MNISIVGIGYVGLSNAILLSQKNNVVALDLDKDKVEMINSRISPIEDKEIIEYLSKKKLNLKATTNKYEAFKDADYIVIATPTDYDYKKNNFKTDSIKKVINEAQQINTSATFIIKSTIPIGFTNKIREELDNNKIIFSPEFLRESKALYDNLHPSRIIIGDTSQAAIDFVRLVQDGAIKKNVPTLFTNSSEAECIKLFSNSYLAMRVAYFNEVDSFLESKNLNSRDVIDGICLDPRIGNHYNNPSFGYGGYCLPKDTKQLVSNFKDIPNNIISAIVDSNSTRIEFVSKSILKHKPNVVGVYRLIMKSNSDNYRNSAILEVMEYLMRKGIEIIIFEPNIVDDTFLNFSVVKDIAKFKELSNIIIANRHSDSLNDVIEKVYSRDLFGSN